MSMSYVSHKKASLNLRIDRAVSLKKKYYQIDAGRLQPF